MTKSKARYFKSFPATTDDGETRLVEIWKRDAGAGKWPLVELWIGLELVKRVAKGCYVVIARGERLASESPDAV